MAAVDPGLNQESNPVAGDGNANINKTRDRLPGMFRGQPAPPPDTSWPVPGEAYKKGPVVNAGPGELKPCSEES